MLFPTQYIYVLNIAIVLILALFVFSGYKQGFLLKALGCLGFLVVGFLAWMIAPFLAKLLHIFPVAWTPMADTIIGDAFYEQLNVLTVFLLLFIIFSIVVMFLRPILKGISSIPVISQANKLLGTVFGFIQGLILMMFVTIILHTPLLANGETVIQRSFLKPIGDVSESLFFFAQDSLAELKSVQKIVTPSTALTPNDIETIRGWLLDNDIEEAQVDDFIESLLQQ